jgi:hypothetical protein
MQSSELSRIKLRAAVVRGCIDKQHVVRAIQVAGFQAAGFQADYATAQK